MLGIGDELIPPPGPEARTGRASSENKAIAVAARFMDFLLCGGLWTQLVQPQLWRSQESVRLSMDLRIFPVLEDQALGEVLQRSRT
jgi:hypothetical protein